MLPELSYNNVNFIMSSNPHHKVRVAVISKWPEIGYRAAFSSRHLLSLSRSVVIRAGQLARRLGVAQLGANLAEDILYLGAEVRSDLRAELRPRIGPLHRARAADGFLLR